MKFRLLRNVHEMGSGPLTTRLKLVDISAYNEPRNTQSINGAFLESGAGAGEQECVGATLI